MESCPVVEVEVKGAVFGKSQECALEELGTATSIKSGSSQRQLSLRPTVFVVEAHGAGLQGTSQKGKGSPMAEVCW